MKVVAPKRRSSESCDQLSEAAHCEATPVRITGTPASSKRDANSATLRPEASTRWMFSYCVHRRGMEAVPQYHEVKSASEKSLPPMGARAPPHARLAVCCR